jgi:hypothetical protein
MGMMSKISKFARGPQGRRLTAEAKRLAKDPETRRKLDQARRRFGRKDRPA